MRPVAAGSGSFANRASIWCPANASATNCLAQFAKTAGYSRRSPPTGAILHHFDCRNPKCRFNRKANFDRNRLVSQRAASGISSGKPEECKGAGSRSRWIGRAFLLGTYAGQSDAGPDRKTAGATGRQGRKDHREPAEDHGGTSSRLLGGSLVRVLAVLIACAFLASCLGLAAGLLFGNTVLVGFVFWLLPRLGFLALVVLLVRFVAAEPLLK